MKLAHETTQLSEGCVTSIYDDRGDHIGDLSGPDAEQRAAAICRAVNSHDALVAALKAYMAHARQVAKNSHEDLSVKPPRFDAEVWRQDDAEGFALYEKSRAALALAGEQGDGEH